MLTRAAAQFRREVSVTPRTKLMQAVANVKVSQSPGYGVTPGDPRGGTPLSSLAAWERALPL